MIIKQLTTTKMEAANKRLVDASVAIQNIIVDAARRTGTLSEDQFQAIYEQLQNGFREFWAEEAIAFTMKMVRENKNLTKGSNSLAAAFDPIDSVKVFEEFLSEQEFDELMDYAKRGRVAYWNF